MTIDRVKPAFTGCHRCFREQRGYGYYERPPRKVLDAIHTISVARERIADPIIWDFTHAFYAGWARGQQAPSAPPATIPPTTDEGS